RNRNDDAASASPVPNLTAVDGPRSPSRTQASANTGASTMIAAGFTDWKNSGEIAMPATSSSVRLFAKADSDDAACSKIIQNSIAATNSGMYATTRERSGRVTLGERSMTAK